MLNEGTVCVPVLYARGLTLRCTGNRLYLLLAWLRTKALEEAVPVERHHRAQFLRQRHGSDRISTDGAEQSKARSLYDMTFSAPKSVSVMAIVGGDELGIAPDDAAPGEYGALVVPHERVGNGEARFEQREIWIERG